MTGLMSRISISSILATTLTAAGCGGDSDSASAPANVYSGLTTPAAIDAGNPLNINSNTIEIDTQIFLVDIKDSSISLLI